MLGSVAVHIALGEVVLTVLLIVFTTVAFTGKGRPQINGSSAEDIDIEVQHPDDEDEPTTANPLNAAPNDASEEMPKLRPLRSPSAVLRRSAPAEAAPVAAARLPFLDNLKVFLTALVVLHHCACAFGACGEGSWYLIVKGGGGPRAFRLCVKTFVTWNQAYFMSLFFFVSAGVEIKFRAPHAIDAMLFSVTCACSSFHAIDATLLPHRSAPTSFRRATRRAGRSSKRTKGGASWSRPSPSSWSCRR